ncbi:hypothetical protein [Clostridium sp. YIM B02506]|uniref:hypothetical protein n=1 Tax=Clostridium sp. YIM B02506 TaxID=2910680 RepID=UPI001EED3F93|nr:hypothetical protein [Clostridium sp. YIM B02506]
MINNLKGNVEIKLNFDIEALKYWQQKDGVTIKSSALKIPVYKIKKYLDVKALIKEFDSYLYDVGVVDNYMEIKFSYKNSEKIITIKDIYDEVSIIKEYISSIVNKFMIEDYKLICDIHPNIKPMGEYSKIEHEKLMLENKLLRMQSDEMNSLYNYKRVVV